MYFIYLYENRAMKSVKIILGRERGKKEKDSGDEPNQRTL
jgi:hypothetical protein